MLRMYSPALLPSRCRAAVAKNRSWSTAGGISSLRVRWIGLPVFSTSTAIISSARDSSASAMRNSASERSLGVVSRQTSKAEAAARIAASMSPAEDSGAVPYTAPVTGLTTSVVRPSAASTCSPSTKLWNALMAADGTQRPGRAVPDGPVAGLDRSIRSNARAWRDAQCHVTRTRDPYGRRAEGDQDQGVPGGDDARRGARVRAAWHRRVGRDRRRQRRELQRRGLRGSRGADRGDGCRGVGAGHGGQGQGAQGGGVRLPPRGPDVVH